MIRIASGGRRSRATSPSPTSFSIGQLAATLGEPAHVMRYYCRIGLLQPTERGANGYRRFDARAQARIRFIRQAQRLGFSLEEIATIFRHAAAGHSPCPDVRQILEKRVPSIGDQFDGLLAMHQRMTRALSRWRHLPDQAPTGENVCALIESEAVGEQKPRRKSCTTRA